MADVIREQRKISGHAGVTRCHNQTP
jgi:hypothetical protein